MVRKINSFRHLRELQTAALPSHLNFVSTSPWRFEDDVQLAVCRPPRTVQHFDLPLRHAPVSRGMGNYDAIAERGTSMGLPNSGPACLCLRRRLLLRFKA